MSAFMYARQFAHHVRAVEARGGDDVEFAIVESRLRAKASCRRRHKARLQLPPDSLGHRGSSSSSTTTRTRRSRQLSQAAIAASAKRASPENRRMNFPWAATRAAVSPPMPIEEAFRQMKGLMYPSQSP